MHLYLTSLVASLPEEAFVAPQAGQSPTSDLHSPQRKNEDSSSSSCKCRGYGECLIQTDDGYKYPKEYCKYQCIIKHCPTCKQPLPQWVLDCNEGECISCAVYTYAYGKRWQLGDCIHCGKKIVPVGNSNSSRKVKKHFDNLDSRKLHESCWKTLKTQNEIVNNILFGRN